MTPARAGTTGPSPRLRWSGSDDPRSRGDDASIWAREASTVDDPRSRGDDAIAAAAHPDLDG